MHFNERDQLLFDQFEETWTTDPEVAAHARNNTIDNFRLVFDRMFMGTVVGRMDDNEAIRRWWYSMGQPRFPDATTLLITADAGGSNGHRVKLWKVELAKLAAETGLAITVCHYPPGTSKWNRIEQKMFSFLSMNCRGRPLVSYRTVIELISATTTAKGLTIRAAEDRNLYETGTKVSDAQLAAVPLNRHEFHGDWNYTIAQSDSR